MPIRFQMGVLLFACVLAGCSREPATTSVPAAASEKPAAQPASVAAAPAPAEPAPSALDWDGARWDAGNVVSFTRDGEKVIVTFDRFSLFQDGKRRDGKALVREPLEYGNTDMPFENTNPKLRRYLLAPNAEVVKVSNTGDLCANAMEDVPKDIAPQFAPLDVDALIRTSKKGDVSAPGLTDAKQDALTFDSNGQITRVVFSGGC